MVDNIPQAERGMLVLLVILAFSPLPALQHNAKPETDYAPFRLWQQEKSQRQRHCLQLYHLNNGKKSWSSENYFDNQIENIKCKKASLWKFFPICGSNSTIVGIDFWWFDVQGRGCWKHWKCQRENVCIQMTHLGRRGEEYKCKVKKGFEVLRGRFFSSSFTLLECLRIWLQRLKTPLNAWMFSQPWLWAVGCGVCLAWKSKLSVKLHHTPWCFSCDTKIFLWLVSGTDLWLQAVMDILPSIKKLESSFWDKENSKIDLLTEMPCNTTYVIKFERHTRRREVLTLRLPLCRSTDFEFWST